VDDKSGNMKRISEHLGRVSNFRYIADINGGNARADRCAAAFSAHPCPARCYAHSCSSNKKDEDFIM